MPDPIKNGVYIYKPSAELVLVTDVWWFLECRVFFRSRQRKPRTVSQLSFRNKNMFEYLGDL